MTQHSSHFSQPYINKKTSRQQMHTSNDTTPANDWNTYLNKYRIYIKLERRLSDNTVEAYMHDAGSFARFATERYGASPLTVESRMIEDFMTELFECDTEKSTQGRMLSGIRSFFNFLVRTDVLESSPAEFIDHPKAGQYLPDTLTVEEIDAIINAIDLSAPQGHRNRTMIETLYSCGLRVSELISLHISDLFLDEGFIRVCGKGNKQRLVPINDNCRRQIVFYLREARETPADERASDTVFLNRRGKPLSRIMVFNIIKDAAAMAGIDKDVSPHTFRHSFATHLLQGGANIRQVQELLGHESITTTEIYTHLDTGHLHQTINEYHPLGKYRSKK